MNNITPFVISVIQDDIENGIKCNSGECPIALAVRRRFITADISVSLVKLRINDTTYRLPQEAMRFINKFDLTNNTVKPFQFTINEIIPK